MQAPPWGDVGDPREGRIGERPSYVQTAPIRPQLGKIVAARSLEKAIAQVVFDRNGFKYHGRVRALAEAAREGGLKF